MKPRTLIILALAVAALAAFIWLFERDLPSSEEREELAKKVFGALETEDVEAVGVTWEDRHLRLERETPAAAEPGEEEEAGEDGESGRKEVSWRLVEPLRARADRQQVEDLLQTLADLEKKRTLEEANEEELGLEPPRVRVTLTTPDGERELRLGTEIPLSGDVAAALAGMPEVYVVAGSVVGKLTREAGDWRDRVVLPARLADIRRLRLDGPGDGPAVVLARDGEGYRIEGPISDRADETEARTLFSNLANLRAQSFVDDPEATPESLGLAPPRAVIEVEIDGGSEAGPSDTGDGETDESEGGKGETVRLEVGSAVDGEGDGTDGFHGRIGDQLFVFQFRDLEQILGRAAEDWRSPKWSAMEVFRVDSLVAEDAEGELVLSRDGPNWRRGEETIPYTAVSDLLYNVTGSEAERLLGVREAAAEGLAAGEPALTFTLASESGEAETLTLYGRSGETLAARASGRDVVFLLPAERLESLRGAVAAVRAAEPLPDESGALPEDSEIGEPEDEDG